jgi:hypothetical protein
MRTSNLLENKTVKFYGNSLLHTPKKALIVEDASKAFSEGREARLNAHGMNENPYHKEDGNAIWTAYDCWIEGYLSVERY